MEASVKVRVNEEVIYVRSLSFFIYLFKFSFEGTV